jgi:protein TonB
MRAAANEKIGVVVVRCTAEADGKLAACSLLCETPEGWGFGKAALHMTKHFRLEPLLADGRSVAGETVIMPLRFNPPFLAPLPRCDGKAD